MTNAQKKTTFDKIKPFMIGGMSGMMSTCVIQPIDMVKVRIQLKSETSGKGAKISPFTVTREMLANGQGVGQFYKGLDSALIR